MDQNRRCLLFVDDEHDHDHDHDSRGLNDLFLGWNDQTRPRAQCHSRPSRRESRLDALLCFSSAQGSIGWSTTPLNFL